MSDQPADPITALMELASSMHELFSAYVSSGFTEQQALYLVGQQIQAMSRPQAS